MLKTRLGGFQSPFLASKENNSRQPGSNCCKRVETKKQSRERSRCGDEDEMWRLWLTQIQLTTHGPPIVAKPSNVKLHFYCRPTGI